MAEVLPNLAPGLLVPPGDPSMLANALSRALQGDNAMPTPEECRRFAEGFHWTPTAEKVIEVFEQARSRPPDRKYRVVFLDHCAKLSGGELALLRLLKGTVATEPHVILAEDGPLIDYLREAGISTEVLPLPPDVANLSRTELKSLPAILRGGAATAKYVAQLARRLRRLNPDLVHANSLKSGLYGSLAAHAAGVPMVWHLRDRLSRDNYPALQAEVLRRCVRTMANAVIADSASTGALLSNGRAPLWNIPSPVDITPVNRTADRTQVIGIVGRIAPWKGQHIFLDAVASLSRRYPNLRARVIGAPLFGEYEYERSLKRQAEDLGIASLVEFPGFSSDVATELARLVVMVHASTVAEPFGQVVVEAMACGVPIIATNQGGPAEILTHGTDGLLVPPGDSDALADAIVQLLEDRDLRVRLAEAAAVKAQRYRPDGVAAEVEAVYASMLTTQGWRSRPGPCGSDRATDPE
jgi:glycosyltransferase involved in cell wall biosynthesis